jgi:OPA family sugar phosphate sensor protein UhpC-like MFS transporter
MALAESAVPAADINAHFRRHRVRVMLAITLGYGFIYTCRLGLSIVKKPVIDDGIYTIEELGMIGAALFYSYAFGKFFNGFLSDHFRPRLFFSASILVAGVVNLFMGLQERGRRYGVWNASHSIGEGLTFYVIAAIVSAFGWRYGFITPGVLCIVAAIWVYSFLQDAPPTVGLPTVHEWLGEESEQDKSKSTWQTQKVVFGIKAMWVVAIHARRGRTFSRHQHRRWHRRIDHIRLRVGRGI